MTAKTSATPSTSDLLLAFRQAKRAFTTERTMIGRAEFAQFELDLDARLRALRHRLRDERWFSEIEIGQLVVVPKGVDDGAPNAGQVVRIGQQNEPRRSASVRLQLAPTPDFVTAEVLYLWTFGPALEALLDVSCVGYRLKRVEREGVMDRHARDVYENWQAAYAGYRDDPISTAQTILKERGRVYITSTDVVSFFDSIDPSFLLDKLFVKRISSAAAWLGRSFAPTRYRAATETLLEAFSRFRKLRSSYTPAPFDAAIGVPIGSLTSRLFANVALGPLDRFIQTRPNVVLYRRYVDDMVVVTRIDDDVAAPSTKTDALSKLFPRFSDDGKGPTFVVPQTKATFRLKESKTRVHDLSGQAGQEFLATVRKSFALGASERRALLGDIDRLESEIEAIDLFDGDAAGADHLPRLRDADRSTLRRFLATPFIRALERCALFLDEHAGRRLVDARARRVLAALDSAAFFESVDIVLALLRIASMLRHAPLRRRLVKWLDDQSSLLGRIQSFSWRDEPLRRQRTLAGLRKYLRARRTEAIASSATYQTESGSRIRTMAAMLRQTDLRHLDREDDVAMFGPPPPLSERTERAFRAFSVRLKDATTRKRLEIAGEFVEAHAARAGDAWHGAHPISVILAARPPTYTDVARRILARAETPGAAPEDVAEAIVRIVDALRGTRYSRGGPQVALLHHDDAGISLTIDGQQPEIVRVVVANLPVDEGDLKAAARGVPRVTMQRLRALDDGLREARRATKEARRQGVPTLLLLPELAIPRRLERSLVAHATTEDISLVAGLEYRHAGGGVKNEAIGVFPLGFQRAITVTWTKRHPARGEEGELKKLGIVFASPPLGTRRLIVQSSHGRVGVLICSEILEAAALSSLTGRIELLLVPAWNPDTGTFEHVTHAAASMLVHGFVAVANNAEASDSRIVAPVAEPRHLREWARIIHRGHSRVIWGDLPVGSLRRVHEGIAPATPVKPKQKAITYRPLPPGWRR